MDLRETRRYRGGGRSLRRRKDPLRRQEPSGPRPALVIDGKGKHITPGIIDCHSHIASDGGINESAQAVTAEVRIGDFINCDDMNIYRQLAGGVTSSNNPARLGQPHRRPEPGHQDALGSL